MNPLESIGTFPGTQEPFGISEHYSGTLSGPQESFQALRDPFTTTAKVTSSVTSSSPGSQQS